MAFDQLSTAMAGDDQISAAGAAVSAWDDAHNHHDIEALRRLYAPSVVFYGSRLPAPTVLAAKADVFRRAPDFRQRLAAIRFDDDGGRVRASFEKAWFQAGKERTIGASIELELVEGRFQIVKEADASAP